MSDLIRREDALKAVHDALVVSPKRDEARKLAGYVISALPAVTVQAQIDAAREAALREALVALQGAGSFGRTAVEKHAALEQYCLCRDAILALIGKGASHE